jgi:hypothetical protein
MIRALSDLCSCRNSMKCVLILPRRAEKYPPRTTALISRPQICYHREISVTLAPDLINLHVRLWWPSDCNWLVLWLKQWMWNWSFSLASKLYHNVIHCSNKMKSFIRIPTGNSINSALSFCISKQIPTVEVCKYEGLCFRNVNWEKVSFFLLLILIRFYVSFFLAVLLNIQGKTVMAP